MSKPVMRRAWRSSMVIAMLCAFAAVMPAAASAVNGPICPAWGCNGNPYVRPVPHHPVAGWSGWGTVNYPDQNCPNDGRVGCGTYTPSFPAWRWTGSWSGTSVWGGTQVYIYPYAVGWSWIWTQRTGWLAMQDKYVWVSGYS